MLQTISGLARWYGKKPRRGYVRAWSYLNSDATVYAPIGLHLILRFLRAAGLAWVYFCNLAGD